MNLRTIGKIGFILVIIGFLMPVACDKNGFEIAKYMMNNEEVVSGILLYILFVSAVIGCFIGVSLLLRRNVSKSLDWLVIIACIASGLIVYFKHLKDIDLQKGAYFILTGWIISFIGQLIPDKS
jgi:uncharacterized membrane protein YfcA